MTGRVWAACVLVGVGCSTPPSFIGRATTDGGVRDASPSVATACSDLAQAQCMELSTCASVLMQTRYGSVTTCESRLSASCTRSLGASGTGATPSQVEACAQAYGSWSCTDYLANANLPSACTPPMGQVATDAGCAFAAECETGFCAIPPHAACGTCTAPPGAGASCAALTTCGPGLVCLPTSGVCGTLGLAGAACDQGSPCGPHLSCVGANTAKHTPGTCMSSVTVAGGACDPTAATGPGCDFDESLVCNGKSKQCEALVVSPPGGVCDISNAQFSTCVASGTCSTDEAGVTGSCIAAAVDGAECSASGAGPACVPPSRCVVTSDGATTGTCQPDGTATCK